MRFLPPIPFLSQDGTEALKRERIAVYAELEDERRAHTADVESLRAELAYLEQMREGLLMRRTHSVAPLSCILTFGPRRIGGLRRTPRLLRVLHSPARRITP